MTVDIIKQMEVRIAGFLRMLIQGRETLIKTSGQDLSVPTQELLNSLESVCDVLRESLHWRTKRGGYALFSTPSADGHSATATSCLQIPLAEESIATAGDTAGMVTRAYPESYTDGVVISNSHPSSSVIPDLDMSKGVDLW